MKIVRRIPKKEVQKMIKALRDAKLTVEKTSLGYKCTHNGKELFHAMNGRYDYLVRMEDNLFTTA